MTCVPVCDLAGAREACQRALVLVQKQLCPPVAVSRLISVPKCDVINEQVPRIYP